MGFDHAKQTTVLFASVSNNAVVISDHGCSDLQWDGQAEWASMK